jgi:hypothetical protein
MADTRDRCLKHEDEHYSDWNMRTNFIARIQKVLTMVYNTELLGFWTPSIVWNFKF